MKGDWMHHETYAVKGEFGEFTLARGRRLCSYFAKPICLLLIVKRTLFFEVSLLWKNGILN